MDVERATLEAPSWTVAEQWQQEARTLGLRATIAYLGNRILVNVAPIERKGWALR